MLDYVMSLIIEGSLESLVQMVSMVQSVKDDMELQLDIRRHLLNYLDEHKLLSYEPFLFVGPKRALQYSVARKIIYSINGAKQSGEALSYSWLLEQLQQLEVSPDPLLKMTQAKRLLGLVEKFGVWRRLAFNTAGLPINFLFVPYRHCQKNAIFAPGLNYIFMFRVTPSTENFPSYIFLHELGHAFHYHSTGDIDVVPASFMEIYNQMFKPCSKEDLPEIFADCFSIAAMYGTAYAEENSFCKLFAEQHQKLLAEYFENLFSTH